MEHYFMNKVLIILISISLLAFGIHFYGSIPTVWITAVMASGYIGLGVIAWMNERKYQDVKREYLKRMRQRRK